MPRGHPRWPTFVLLRKSPRRVDGNRRNLQFFAIFRLPEPSDKIRSGFATQILLRADRLHFSLFPGPSHARERKKISALSQGEAANPSLKATSLNATAAGPVRLCSRFITMQMFFSFVLLCSSFSIELREKKHEKISQTIFVGFRRGERRCGGSDGFDWILWESLEQFGGNLELLGVNAKLLISYWSSSFSRRISNGEIIDFIVALFLWIWSFMKLSLVLFKDCLETSYLLVFLQIS